MLLLRQLQSSGGYLLVEGQQLSNFIAVAQQPAALK